MPVDPVRPRPPRNRARLSIRISQAGVAAGVCIMLLPVVGLVSFSKGGGVFLLVGGVFAYIFRLRARMESRLAMDIEAIRQGQGALARWTYTEEDWARYLRNSRLDQIPFADRYRLWELILMLAVMLAVVAFGHDIRARVGAAFLALLAVILLGVDGLHRVVRNANRKRRGEIIVTDDGVLFNHEFTRWREGYAELLSVAEVGQPYPHILVTYATRRRFWGKAAYHVHIPVPDGRGIEAQCVVERLTGLARSDAIARGRTGVSSVERRADRDRATAELALAQETEESTAEEREPTREDIESMYEQRRQEWRRWRPWLVLAGSGLLAIVAIMIAWQVLSYRLDQRGYLYEISDFSGDVRGLRFSPDSRHLVAKIVRGDTSTVIAWDTTTRKRVFTRSYGDYGISQLRFSPDGTLLAVASASQLDVLSFPTGNVVFRHMPYDGSVEREPRFSADLRFLATNAKGVSLWDLRSGALLRTVVRPHFIHEGRFAFASTDELIVLNQGTDSVEVITLTADSMRSRTAPLPRWTYDISLVARETPIAPLVLLGDGTNLRLRTLASILDSAGSEGLVLRGVRDMREWRYLPRRSPVSLLVQTRDRMAMRFRCADGRGDAAAPLPGAMQSAVIDDASPDGSTILFRDAHEGYFLWSFAHPDGPLHLTHRESPIQFSTSVTAACIAPDGRLYATGRKTIRVRPIP
jgi:WD40 repeat protein